MTALDHFVSRTTAPEGVRLPPGPTLPAPLQTFLFISKRHVVAPLWRRRYGDVFSVNLAPAGRAVILTRPEHIKAVFSGAPDTFHAGEGNAILGPVMGEHSVLLLDEDEHREARKRVMAAFHGETMRGWAEAIEQIAADSIAGWPVGDPFAVHRRMNDISLEVILRIVFGVTDEERLDELRPLLRQLVNVTPLIFLGWFYPQLRRIGPWRRYEATKQRVDELLYAEIAERRTVAHLADRTDVLSRLLIGDATQSDAELRDHLITLLLAGHETTASALAWALHDLARRPDVQAKVQRAIDAGAPADHDYLEATVKEALRRRPVIANVARRLAKPAQVAGYDLPAGVVVFPSILLVHRTPSLYPSPQEFRPERFLDGSPPPATWIPFGGGIRRCLGAALAMVEAEAVLKAVFARLDVAPAGGEEKPRTRNITTVPARGARIVIRPR